MNFLNEINKLEARIKELENRSAPSKAGWVDYKVVVPTRTAANDPSYTLQFAGVDLTNMINAGTRIRWTQNSIVRYGIVTDVSYSSNTTVEVLTRCDGSSANYDVLDTSSNTISDLSFSYFKAPVGFPMSPEYWTIRTTDETQRTITTAVTWLKGHTSHQIVVPKGSWRIGFSGCLLMYRSTTGDTEGYVSLTSIGYGETDDLCVRVRGDMYNSGFEESSVCRYKHVTLTATTTTYELWMYMRYGTQLVLDNDDATLVIEAECAYL
jgi:hypothetical protein